jgi:cytochrome oxidase Cu insertion factor (SCO1/SenC/PrrC family)
MLRRLTLQLALATSVAAGLGAQVNINALGPQVGGKAIPFELSDQTGRARTLASLAGPKGTMLVFFRSADW